MKQTAIDYLVESIFNESELQDPILKLAIQQAKAMEKEQHFESYRCGNLFLDENSLDFEGYFEQYYNETYNK
jgi:hypothetical protein